MSRARTPILAALSCAAIVGVGAASSAETDVRVEAEARRVVAELFRTLDGRRYARTCALLADGFFAEGPTLGRKHCALGLRIGFTGSPELRVRLGDVRAEDDRAVVEATVNGVRGRILLVRESGRLRVLRLDGP